MSADPALQAEREHLRRSRADLATMREHTLSLTAQSADHVSTEYLKAALYRRAKALEDDPSLPLFFGRIDRIDPDDTHESFHIGRRHVMDGNGDPMVVDWRADVSRAFYRATRADPHGVTLRRRYGFAGGELTSYEDEHLLDPGEADVTSRILTEEIERPRVGPMRDIVATIQPEQDEVVRAGLDRTVCVQGAPGTGKTAVGLHRAAYLLHTYRERLARTGVLVIGPNQAFLHYIAQVLPTLGEVDVRQVTVAELVGTVPVRSTDAPGTAGLKGDERLATVLRNAIWSHVREPEETLYVTRGTRRWRVPVHEVADAVATLRERGDGYTTARSLLGQRLAHRILLRMEAAGEITDDRVQNAVARSRPVKQYVDELWPALDPVKLVMRLLSEPELLATAAAGILDDEEQRTLLWAKPARGPKTAPWSHADAVLVDEAAAALERVPGVGHVVLDEAQDLSPMELRAVGRRAGTGSLTVLGDIAQGTTPWATPSWPEALRHLAHTDAHLEVLRKGYRVPASVVEFAGRLLPVIAPGIAPPEPVRSNPGRLDITRTDGELTAAVTAATAEVAAREGSVGIIVADDGAGAVAEALRQVGVAFGELADDQRVTVVPATLAKGLEYDHVIVAEPAAIVAAEPAGLRRLYVVLTRAVSSLTVVHSQPLPDPLTHQ
ncbi:HelD family protein [Jiangella mangrovi]|uniref:DNA helicase IV n=1 Tax=Jiangella mangrovi TaxID=1524084 RepID=A0A7W9LJY6_9ACTN|nr:AAA family ATPase [Jiangella mangrovi]MBB5786551.1 DNA helicase IV [Jiangella mangrovi]